MFDPLSYIKDQLQVCQKEGEMLRSGLEGINICQTASKDVKEMRRKKNIKEDN